MKAAMQNSMVKLEQCKPKDEISQKALHDAMEELRVS